MDHDRTRSALLDARVIVVLRGISKERVLEVVGALERGGIKALEFALPHGEGSNQASVYKSIQKVREHYPCLLVGCGTVLSPEEAQEAAKSGALFAISPTYDREVITESRRLGLVSIPGAYSPTEIERAYRYGADIVKVFPAGELGPGFFKAMQGPLGHIPLAAVAGITPDNAQSFLDAGASCLGVSSYIANPSFSAEQMEERARLFLSALR